MVRGVMGEEKEAEELEELAEESPAEEVEDPSADNHLLEDGAVKRLTLTDRDGDAHTGKCAAAFHSLPFAAFPRC